MKNWNEDFNHENGQYENKCVICGETFIGRKRRVVCKECTTMNKKYFGSAFGWLLTGLNVGGIGHSIYTKEYGMIILYAIIVMAILLSFCFRSYVYKISKRNLCDSCKNEFATCDSIHTYGDSVGKDNVCICLGYRRKKDNSNG